jgi:hypothetical protein
MYSEFFDDKSVSRLISEGIQGSHINDDALARCLDALYDACVYTLHWDIAEKVMDLSNSPANLPIYIQPAFMTMARQTGKKSTHCHPHYYKVPQCFAGIDLLAINKQ